MLFDRTMVLDPSTEVSMEVLGQREATCSVDGRELMVLGEGDMVVCTVADRVARLVTFGPRVTSSTSWPPSSASRTGDRRHCHPPVAGCRHEPCCPTPMPRRQPVSPWWEVGLSDAG